jgi:hypothetical protein
MLLLIVAGSYQNCQRGGGSVEGDSKVRRMRPKARVLTQYGGSPSWLDESDPAGCDFVRDGWTMPPALTDHTTCSGPGLIYYLMYTKTLSWATSRKEGGMAWYSSRPKLSGHGFGKLYEAVYLTFTCIKCITRN